MTVLDAYAVLAYLRDEVSADAVGELLRAPTTLSAVNATEVIDQLVRGYGHATTTASGWRSVSRTA
ncbi:MAG: hypothetical protein ACRDQA_09615 [Nocardioidaceae bacterium]